MSKRYGNKYINNPEDCLIDLYRKRGEVYRLIGNYQKAFDGFKRMSIAACLTGKSMLKADAITQIASVHLFKSEFLLAEESYQQALQLYKSHNILAGQAECYKNLGKIFQYRERNTDAFSLYNHALFIYQELKDQFGEYGVLESLAEYYFECKDYEKALEMLTRVYSYYDKNNHIAKKVRTLQNIAKVYRENNDFEKGFKYFNQAYDNASKIGDHLAIVYLLCDIGLICYAQGNYSLAKSRFENSLQAAVKHDNKYMIAVSLLNLGDACAKLNEKNEATMYVKRMLSLNIGIQGLTDEANRIINEINL